MTPKQTLRYSSKPWVAWFWSHVNKAALNGCWEWMGARNSLGYGQYRTRDPEMTTRYPHRIAYILLVGPVPEGKELDHLCRNPACLNPEHLEPVTHKVNLRRGNTINARAQDQTHCKRGHLLSPDNIYWKRYTWGVARNCRRCQLEIHGPAGNRRHRDANNARRREKYHRDKALREARSA